MSYATRLHDSRTISRLFAILVSGFVVSLPSLTIAQTSEEERAEMEEARSEEDYESSSSSSSSSGYSSSSSSGSNKQADLSQSYKGDFASKFQNIDLTSLLMPDNIVEVDDTPILQKEADQIFLAGNQPLALQFTFGYMVAEFEKAAADLQRVKYSPALRRPVWQVRWGVSLAIRGADDVVDPEPIREGKTTAGRPAASGQGSGQFSGEDDDDFEDGSEARTSGVSMAQAFSAPAAYGLNNAPMTSMLSFEAEQDLDSALGLVAEVVGKEFQKRYDQGDFGPVLTSVTPPAPPLPPAPVGGGRKPPPPPPPQVTQAVADALSDSPDPIPMWRPGIVYLGQGDSKDMIVTANTEGIDFLLHFDVFIKQGRQGRTEFVQNVSRCRLLQVNTGKALGVSKSIDSIEAARLVQTSRGSARAYVEDQLANLLGIIDRQAKTVDLPSLTPEIAKKRITSLIGKSQGKSLSTLAEVRLYQAQGLIDEALAESVFNIVGGEDALTMMHGPVEDRITMAREWAVKSQNREDESSSF